ncbi:MAG: hypothetical protein KJS92_03570 [Bacteroidetes bacterium]|nr:hypothetical protein [Bacteroidota bacterium]
MFQRNNFIGLLLFLTSGSTVLAQVNAQNSIRNIGNRRELFTDYWLIDSMKNTVLVMHEPVDRGVAVPFNNPAWEAVQCTYATVLQDDTVFRLYYRAGIKGTDDFGFQATAYARSRDGINWTKPELNLYQHQGNTRNNIVLTNSRGDLAVHNFSPFIDKRPGVSGEEKYKALGGVGKGLYAYVSADGINWRRLTETPVLTQAAFDGQNVAFWSESEQQYVCFYRTWTGPGNYQGFRTVGRAVSKDFINWTMEGRMDFGNTPSEHLYINQTAPYFRAPHLYVGTAARYVTGRSALSIEQTKPLKLDQGYYTAAREGVSDAVLLTSRGGNRMDRTFMTSFIRPGIGNNNWVSRSNFPALNVVQTGPAEMSVYVVQDYAQPTNHLHRYSLRLDGFSSVQAPYTGGEMLTRPFTFAGNSLYLNYSSSAAGGIAVELTDLQGKALPGFAASQCNLLIGNEINRKVSWNGNPDLKALNGKAVRIRFIMKDANLYSLKFE